MAGSMRRRCLVAAALAATIGAALAAGTDPAETALRIHYQERPPYSHTAPDGRAAGLLVMPLEQALVRAGIPHRWVSTPSQRQLALVQGSQGLDCGLGWFHTADRAERGRFSRALSRDPPFVVVARPGAPLPGGALPSTALDHPALTLLLKEGYSYGPALDRLVATGRMRVQRTAVEPLQMARMLASGRADAMFASADEAELLQGAGLRLHPLADLRQGQTRHLYCSLGVPAAWLARIDVALPPLP